MLEYESSWQVADITKKSRRSCSNFSGATLHIQYYFSWRLHPSQEQEAEKAPEEVEEYPNTWATGKGWAAGGPFSSQRGLAAGSGGRSIPHHQERLSRCSALLPVT